MKNGADWYAYSRQPMKIVARGRTAQRDRARRSPPPRRRPSSTEAPSIGDRVHRDLRIELQGTCAHRQHLSRSRGAAGIVTSTTSGFDWRDALDGKAEHGHMPTRRHAGSSPPLRRRNRRRAHPASRAARAAGSGRCSADQQRVRRRSCRSRNVAWARNIARSASAGADEHESDERVEHVDPLQEVAERAARQPTIAYASPWETMTAMTMRRLARPAKRQTPLWARGDEAEVAKGSRQRDEKDVLLVFRARPSTTQVADCGQPRMRGRVRRAARPGRRG